MGNGGFSSIDYSSGVDRLRATGKTFARSAAAAATGNFGNLAEVLDPRKLKNGTRECCFAPGFDDALPIVVSIDGTGSMEQVPREIQADLPKLIGLITSQGIADRPNVLFMCHDDERAVPPDAAFQMSQFETEAPKLLEALNELVIPGNGGGNRGEAYHLPIYAAAYHTRLETFERDGSKGFFFLIGDEEPYYGAGDPAKNGTSPALAKELFGDTRESVVTMLEAMKELCKRYHVFVIRPGHTSHGGDMDIARIWKKLLKDAGEDPEHVLLVAETEAIIPTMALTIGSVLGADREEMVNVLRTSGASGVDTALVAVTNVASAGNSLMKAGTATTAIATGAGAGNGRRRR